MKKNERISNDDLHELAAMHALALSMLEKKSSLNNISTSARIAQGRCFLFPR